MRRVAALGLAAVVGAGAFAFVFLTRGEDPPKPAYRYEQFVPPWEHEDDVMLSGRVVDSDGKPIAGVFVSSEPTEWPMGLSTGEGGSFVDSRVFYPGLYRMRFQKCGFRPIGLENVRVRQGVITVVDVTLEPREERC